jgi:hypothetical protein
MADKNIPQETKGAGPSVETNALVPAREWEFQELLGRNDRNGDLPRTK